MTGKVFERLRRAIEAQERCLLFTVVEGEAAGEKLLVFETGETVGGGPAELVEQADELMRDARNRSLELSDGTRVLAEYYGPPPRLVIYGAVDLAEAMCQVARTLGWTSIVADARGRFATVERIPSADQLIVKWPEEAFAEIAPDAWTAVVVLTHDDKFDVPALKAALASDAVYVGALGSRRNQERRRERLLEAGVAEDELARIAGPCGLDIGADTQPETAISIIGEILAVRAKRDGGRLQEARQRIHVEVD
jgi:xanthine dehydrogenase accessory factor